MKKKQIVNIFGALAMSAPLLADGDWRAPLSLAHSHGMRLQPVERAWWYDLMPSKKDLDKDCCTWHFHKWVSLYSRSAGSAFQAADNSDSVTRNTQSLATLFFGKEKFKIAEAFSNGNIDDIAQLNKYNPLIAAAYVMPSYEYNEKGVCVGGQVSYNVEDSNWHVGGSVVMPINVVEVKPNTTVGKTEETLEDLFKVNVVKATKTDALDTEPVATTEQYQNDLAIRADFLNNLMLDERRPLVQVDGDHLKVGYITINGANQNSAQAYVIKKTDHLAPAQPYRKLPTDASSALSLNGDGTNNQVFFVKNATDYELSKLDTESTLWVVPRRNSASSIELTRESQSMVNQILYAVQIADLANRSASDFLADNGLFLNAYERRAGLGDIKLCFHTIYHDQEDDWFVKLAMGTNCPTGSKRDDQKALRVLQLQTGNNGHWELFVAATAGWQPLSSMSFDVSASANHAFARDEWVPAAFVGATAKNMGPAVEAGISWNYFTAQANLNFFHPHNPELGCTVGYSFFAKNKDHVHYKDVDATDFFGNEHKQLDVDVAAQKTNAMTHAVRAELFHRWNYFKLKAGACYDFAGRNAMKSTEAHIGMSVSF
ncbi:hypothetical protein IPH25_04145 [bacterium]|nr:MAG: hypothetical protein IPG37_01140 [bacterium]QQR61638.1 MAG: hypothetical protein IPH25_04145 [bacterium]